MTPTTTRDIPVFDEELFSEAALLDPYPLYRRLRELGPVVSLPGYDAYAIPRFEALKAASKNSIDFISGKGVFLNDVFNTALQGNATLCTDGALHDTMRKLVITPLIPRALEALKERVQIEADTLIEQLVARREFDAATDLARHLPVTIVSNLVGLPEEGRERMLNWSFATFNTAGPMNDRLRDSMPLVKEMLDYILTCCAPGMLKPGSWGEALFKAVERGEIRPEQCPAMLLDYVGPSLDTTIAATTHTLRLLAQHPAQWQMIREDAAWIPHAINEAIRLESPIQFFARYVANDTVLEGVPLLAGERVVLYYGSANRCETKWQEPDRFDITRKPVDHVGFGVGAHSCAGMNLARLEIGALLRALAPRVAGFEIGTPVLAVNNALRMLSSLPMRVH